MNKPPVNSILQSNKKDSFPESVKNAIKLLSFVYDNSAPYGSYIYRAQPYPSDVDVMERVIECCGKKSAINKIIEHFRQIIKGIKKKKDVYFGDIKAGLDMIFFDIYAVYIKKFKPKSLKPIIKELYNKKYIDKEIYNDIKKILDKKQYSNDDVEDLKNIFRELYIIRWKPDEILGGEKKLSGGRTIRFCEAIQQPTMTKFDILLPINGKYTEVTNVYNLYYVDKKKGEPVLLNFDDKIHGWMFIRGLKLEVEKYASRYYFKPFKLMKRMFSLSRFLGDKNTSVILIDFFHTDFGKLGQMSSELDTLSLILKTIKNPNMKIIKNQLDAYKKTISNIIDIDLNTDVINGMLTLLTNDKLSHKEMVDVIDGLHDYLYDIVSKTAYQYLVNNRLFPPPKQYLPSKEDKEDIMYLRP